MPSLDGADLRKAFEQLIEQALGDRSRRLTPIEVRALSDQLVEVLDAHIDRRVREMSYLQFSGSVYEGPAG